MNFARYTAAATAAELREFVPVLHELIGVAFSMIRPHFLRGTAVESKHDASPVTRADRDAERAMRQLIALRYPDHGVIGEEYGEKVGKKTGDKAGVRYRWVLDPIDGTRAFITNCFLFGTLIAIERDDGDGFAPLLGVIAHPAAKLALIGSARETRLYADDGSQRRVRVRACSALENATVLATTHWSTTEQRGGPAVDAIIRCAALYRTWGDCFGYFALATGGADLMLDPTLSYWDVAAIVPVVEGAGGVVTAWDGNDPLRSPSLIASAGALHPQVLDLLRNG